MQEITNILKDTKVAQPFSKRIKLEKRTQMNPIRRFILFIVIKPALANKDDLTLFSAKESEQILAKSVIEIALENKDNNAAVMLHLISNKIDKSILREMEDQIVKIDGDLPIEEEVKALRNSLQKKLLSSANKTKLGELQQKSLGSLTDEEKTFLKNIRRK
jgi:DNA primase